MSPRHLQLAHDRQDEERSRRQWQRWLLELVWALPARVPGHGGDR